MDSGSDAQRRVLSHRRGGLLVVGGPGSGKTSLAIELTATNLEGRTPDGPGPVLLTFSRRAASTARNRITRTVGRTTQPAVFTFHSLCLALLRRFGTEEQQQLRLLTAPEQEFRVRELLMGRGPGGWPPGLSKAYATRQFARQVRTVLARARQLGLDPEDVTAAGVAADRPEWVAVGDFFAEYLDVLGHEGAVDYAELVHLARILVADGAVSRTLRREISMIVVDEYAEADPAQIGLLRALVPPDGAVVAFADPDQALFGFRGAHPRAVADFPTTFADPDGVPAPVIPLLNGYRCAPVIAAAAARIRRRIPVPALPGGAAEALRAPAEPDPDGGSVEVFTCATESDQAARLAERLRAAHLLAGLPWSDMAVIVRSGSRQLAPLARALSAAGVPVEIAGDEIPLAAELAVRPLLLALDIVRREGRATPEEAVRLLCSPLGGLNSVSLRSLGRALREAEQAELGQGIPLPGTEALLALALAEPDRLDGCPPGPEVAAARTCASVLVAGVRAMRAGKTPGEVLWTLWRGTAWPEGLEAAARIGGEVGQRADRDLDAVRALFAAAAGSDQVPGPPGIRGFLAEVIAQEIPADTEREDQAAGRSVRLLTVHRAKGLQWPLVAVASAQEGSWPDLTHQATVLDASELVTDGLSEGIGRGRILADERRAFHVACTRAQQQLIVTAVAGTDGEADEPSRFLEELGQPIVTDPPASDLPLTLTALVAELRRAALDPSVSPLVRDAAASRLARLADAPLRTDADPSRWWGLRALSSPPVMPGRDVRLTPSQMAGLLNCPRQYFLDRRANAAGPRSAAASLGSVIHVLAEHAVADGLGSDDLSAQLDAIWERIPFDASWLSSSERGEAESALARFLLWQELHRDREVIGVEVPFDVTVALDGRPIRLVGTVDRLERTPDGQLRVIDFKTGRRAPSRAEVAGLDQLGLYQVAVEAGAFAEVAGTTSGCGGASAVYLRLADGAEDYPKEFHQASLVEQPHLSDDPEELSYPTWAHHRLARSARVLEAGRFPATPGESCRFCEFASSCPARVQGRQVVT